MRKPSSCVGCPFYGDGKGFVAPFIGSEGETLLLGPAPDEAETKAGKLYVGQTGRMLDLVLWQGGYSQGKGYKPTREEFAIANLVQCAPPGPLKGLDAHRAITHCAQAHIKPLLDEYKPRYVVALGDVAFEELTGERKITEKRGYRYPVRYLGGEYTVVGTYHPSFLAQGQSGLIPAALFDMKHAPKKPTSEPQVITDPSIYQASQWFHSLRKSKAKDYLSVDLETSGLKGDNDLIPEAGIQITWMSVYAPGLLPMAFPWVGPFIDLASEMLADPIDKVGANLWLYDIRVLKAHGIEVAGKIQDVRFLWHFLMPDLPASLGYISSFYTDLPYWKDSSRRNIGRYAALDAYAAGVCYEGVKADLMARKVETYE